MLPKHLKANMGTVIRLLATIVGLVCLHPSYAADTCRRMEGTFPDEFVRLRKGSNIRELYRRTILELDKSLNTRHIVQEHFEVKLDSLRERLAKAETDSAQWFLSNQFFEYYRYNNIDSAQHYVLKEYTISRKGKNPRLELMTELNEIRLLCNRNLSKTACLHFNSLDTSLLECDRTLLLEYLSCGNSVYSGLVGYANDDCRKNERTGRDRLCYFRLKYHQCDSNSSRGARIYSQYLFDKGDYRKCLQILYPHIHSTSDLRQKAAIAFYLSRTYAALAQQDSSKFWIAYSSLCDLKSGSREYLSLCKLATQLYEDRDLKRAERYITTCFSDYVVFSNNSKMVDTGEAQLVISKARKIADHKTAMFLTAILCIVTLLLLIILYMFRLSFRQQQQLKKFHEAIVQVNMKLNQANRQLYETNFQLLRTNEQLKEANSIKENYVFKYMELSSIYLGNLEKMRISLRSLAKTKGVDAVVKKLRTPLPLEAEYEKFYRIFDETFLNMFPNFVKQMNTLLKDTAQIQDRPSKTLSTEARIFALIRLGIRESGQIATFLNRSATTIYTYRTKLKRNATCPKDEFEERLCKIGT